MHLNPLQNDRGMTMLFTLLIMVLLTVMGLAAINTTSIETMISGAEAKKRAAFYAAESGVEHASSILRSLCVARNQSIINLCTATGGNNCKTSWTFAIDGSEDGISAASEAPSSGSWLDRYNSGALWIDNRDIGNGYSYSVRVWDNQDGCLNDDGEPITNCTEIENAQEDTDGAIHVGAIATGPNNSRAAIEVMLQGDIDDQSASATYTAQAGAGAGKNYNAADVNAISGANLSGLSSMSTP